MGNFVYGMIRYNVHKSKNIFFLDPSSRIDINPFICCPMQQKQCARLRPEAVHFFPLNYSIYMVFKKYFMCSNYYSVTNTDQILKFLRSFSIALLVMSLTGLKCEGGVQYSRLFRNLLILGIAANNAGYTLLCFLILCISKLSYH